MVVGSQVIFFSQDACAKAGSEKRIVCCPVVVTDSKKGLSLLPFVVKATRMPVPAGIFVPDNWKQNPLTPCDVALYGCCPPVSFNSSAMPAPHPLADVPVDPVVHNLPFVFGKPVVEGGWVWAEQLTFFRSTQSL